MPDPSASISPTLASAVTALVAAPAVARAEGAAAVDFSAVLAGLNLGTDLAEAPETAPPPPVDLTAIQAANTGKAIAIGNRPGKILPPGKPPAAETEDRRDPEADPAEADIEQAPRALHVATTFATQDQLAPQDRAAPAAPQPLPAASTQVTEFKPETQTPAQPRPTRERQALKASTALPLVAAAPLPRSALIAASVVAESADAPMQQPAPSASPAPAQASAAHFTVSENRVAIADPESVALRAPASKTEAAAPARSAAPASTFVDALPVSEAAPIAIAATPATMPAEPTSPPVSAPVEAAVIAGAAPAAPATPQPPVAAPVLATSTEPAASDTTPAVKAAPFVAIALPKVEVHALPSQAPVVAVPAAPIVLAASETATVITRPRIVAHAEAETFHASFSARTMAPSDLAPSNIPAAAPETVIATNVTAAPLSDARPMPTLATTQAPAGPDLAALVDRIVEARAAAAPDTVRAALVHKEFGSVSLQMRADDSHIQVTLGSADPTFAPAVHAAAASLAGTAQDGAREAERREQAAQHQPHQQPGHQAGAADAQTSQQHQSARNSASTSERVPSRENGPTRSASQQARQSQTASDRRSGIYA